MDIEKIRQLVEIVSAHGLTRLEVRDEGYNSIVSIEKYPQIIQPPYNFSPAVTTPLQDTSANQTPPPTIKDSIPQAETGEPKIEVKSPIVGVFYAAQSPDAMPFVNIGSQVKKGDVLCIIEAMKLMNEVVAENDGEIIDICVKSGEMVEFGQVMFRMRPL